MRKFLSLLLTMAMVLSLAVTVNAAAPKEDITILHTNDVHCDYEKYAKVATLHKSADLLVLDGNPLDDITAISVDNMTVIMKEGMLVKNEL